MNQLPSASISGTKMHIRINQLLSVFIRGLLIATALTPLVVSSSTPYPYIFTKVFFYRFCVEAALLLFLAALLYREENWRALCDKCLIFSKYLRSNPLLATLAAFFISLLTSSFTAEDSFRAFWGSIEYSEGVFGLGHFYLFLLLTIFVFESKDWLNYFKISLVGGAVIIAFAIFEKIGLSLPLLGIVPKVRPESLVGNAAWLAEHLIFLITFAAILLLKTFHAERRRAWWSSKNLAVFIIPSALLVIFLTATRGVIFGFVAGLAVFLILLIIRGNFRKTAVASLLILLLLAGIFVVTYKQEFSGLLSGLNHFTGAVPVFDRDVSVAFRLNVWGISLQAFKERPFLGWGPENYKIAYQKYYDPGSGFVNERLVDRAHNKILDILIAQGVLGLISYLGILVSIFFILFRRLKENSSPSLVLAFGFSAYLAQSLFTFDNIVSYVGLFALIGFLLHTDIVSFKESDVGATHNAFSRALRAIIVILIGAVLVIGYFYNILPYMQARAFKQTPEAGPDAHQVLLALERATEPYNFAQSLIRWYGIDFIYLQQYFGNKPYLEEKKFSFLGEALIELIDEVIRREPYDARMNIREVNMLNAIAGVSATSPKEKAELYKKGELSLRNALKLAPKYQEIHYLLAFNVAALGRLHEAEDIIRGIIKINPSIARSHLHLALILSFAGKKEEARLALEEAGRLDPEFHTFNSSEIGNAEIIKNYLNIDSKAK